MYKVLGVDQKEYGPVSADQIREWIAQHRLNAQSQIQAEGDPVWRPLGQSPEFAALFAQPIPMQAAPVYSAYPPAMTGARPRTNPLATTSLILGGASVFVACCCYGFPFNVLGIVFAVIALTQIRNNPAWETGAGLAWAGLALSILSIVLAVMLVLMASAIDQNFLKEFLEKIQNP